MDLGERRARIATALAGVTGGPRAYEVWPDTFNAPGAIVRPDEPVMTQTGQGDDWQVNWIVDVLVPAAAGIKHAQGQLDAYLDTSGAGSLIAAIDALGNAAVMRVAGYGEKSLAAGNTVYFGARLHVVEYV